MKSKKMRFYGILSMMLLGGISVFSGCMDSNDVYNPDRLQEEAKKAFPVKDIDPNQTWETSTICNASVAVNEKTGGTYTIKVYTENPYNTNGNAHLLAKTSVTDGQTVNFKFDIPSALQYVFVMKVNGEGYSSAVPVAVENGNAKVTFGGEATTQRMATTRGATTRADVWKPNELPTKEPADSKQLPQDQSSGVVPNGNYILSSNIQNISIGKPVNLYIKGEVTISQLYIAPSYWDNSTSSNIAGQPKIFLLPGSKLTYKKGSFDSKIEVNICKDANLLSDIITLNAINLYNCGTITADGLSANGTSNLINEGEIKLKEKLSWTNSNCILVNSNHISANELSLEGSAQFYNEDLGTVTILNDTKLSSSQSVWQNDGSFTTGTMHLTASSNNWINQCKLYVKELFDIQTGNGENQYFGLDANSYVECGSLHMDQGEIRMGSKSFFNVLGEAKFKHNPKGFIATGEDYALLKMGSAVQENKKQGFSNSYKGKLYIACDQHFAQGNDGQADHPLYDTDKEIRMTGTDNADIKIPASTCTPGYNSTPDGGGENDKVIEYAYAFEDMMKEAGDYDFNDVVLFVTSPYSKEGKRVIDATLKAAGATKKLAVLFKNGTATTTLFENVHTALGVAEGTIVNTGAATGTPSTVTIEVGENFNLTNNGDFYISDGQREIHIPNFTTGFTPGDVPYALRIPQANWKWPKEQIQITEAYSGFADWAKDATQAPDWYNSYNNNKVIGIE